MTIHPTPYEDHKVDPQHHVEQDDVDSSPTDDLQIGVGGRGRTQRHLRNYQVTMIGFCSGIGTGLFVGTGAAYAKSGPAGLLLAYTLVGSVLWAVMQSIAEIGTLLPTAGTFPHWATRFLSPAVGFSLSISYGYCYAIAIPTELSAAAVLITYWSDITPAVTISICLALILFLNLLPVRWYGDSEVIGGFVKVGCFIILAFTSIIISAGGGPNHEAIGFRYWHDPGAWTDYDGITGSAGHFLGFLGAFVNASFSYVGVETVILTAAEAVDPHVALPKAARRVTLRIAFFYILGAFLIGIIVSPTNASLVSGTGNANSSPFVIAIQAAGIQTLPSFINALIIVSAVSAGNSYLWVASRILVAMTTDNQLPQVFGRVTKKGVPYVAVLTAWLFGLLAYLSLGSGGPSQAFAWLQNISTIAGLIAWATLCVCFIRFHAALKAQNVDRKTLPWMSPLQPFTAWYGFVGATLLALLAGFSVFVKGEWDTQTFIASYIGFPIFFVPIIIWTIVYRTKFARASTIDLWSGRLVEGEITQSAKSKVSPWMRVVHMVRRR